MTVQAQIDALQRRDAILALLALPDPLELQGKRYVRYRYHWPKRDRDQMIQELISGWLARSLLERDTS